MVTPVLIKAQAEDSPQLTAVTPPEDDSCTQSLSDTTTYTMWYDPSTELVYQTVELPETSYLGAGYGETMTNTDMIIWIANGDSSSWEQAFATGHAEPTEYPGDCYT